MPLLGLISMAQLSVSDQGKPEVSPLSASSTQHMCELLVGNRTAVLPQRARARRIMGLVYVCPFL